MAERYGEIHVHGRVYTYSRHLRANLHRHPEATVENIGRVLRDPAKREKESDRRYIYWGYVPREDKFMIVVEDRLPTGEYQILSAYCPIEQPSREEIYGQNAT